MAEARYTPPPRRFSPAMLGRLQEVSSAIQCECPNQLAAILVSLGAFEDYSKACESRNAEDARVHRMLYEETARARVLLEDALVRLCAHEGIDFERLR